MNRGQDVEGFFVKLTCIGLLGFNMYFFYKNGGLNTEHILAGLLLNTIFIVSTFLYVKLRGEIAEAMRLILEKVLELIHEIVTRRAV